MIQSDNLPQQRASGPGGERVALITGVTGQDGSYLAELLLGKGYRVHGMVRRTSVLTRSRIDALRADDRLYGKTLFLHYGDLNDATTLRRILHQAQPDEVYHLAGQSHVGLSFEIPESTCDEVGMATLRLYEICRDLAKPPRIYHAASSEIFGSTPESPQNENTPLRPATPYGCAKAFATQLGEVYRQSYGLFIVNGILYNHESPRRGENFVTRKISLAAARIKLGLQDKLILGSLESRRDWGHAEDYVEAMWLMLQAATAEDYVVATGQTHSVQDFVEAAFAVVGLPWKQYVEQGAAFGRPSNPDRLCGDSSKIRRRLGWAPRHTFEALVREMVESDLAQLSRA